MSNSDRLVAHDTLLDFAVKVFMANGVPEEDADLVVRCLLDANLRGIDSHGITRVRAYVERIKAGGLNPRPQMTLERKGVALGHLNGDNGLGQLVGMRAIEASMEIARETGSAVVVCNHGNHLGALATYVDVAAKAGFLATIAQAGAPIMAPHGGMQPIMGNNPIAYGFPSGNEAPFVLDIAHSTVARGKVLLAAKEGRSIPEGMAIDADGMPTTDATAAANGAMLPMAGHKGSGLAIAIAAMSCLLSGANVGLSAVMQEDFATPRNVGTIATAIDISRLMTLDEFQSHARSFLGEIRDSRPAPGFDSVRVPGDRAHSLSQERLRHGIPVGAGVLKELHGLGKEFKIDTSGLEGIQIR